MKREKYVGAMPRFAGTMRVFFSIKTTKDWRSLPNFRGRKIIITREVRK